MSWFRKSAAGRERRPHHPLPAEVRAGRLPAMKCLTSWTYTTVAHDGFWTTSTTFTVKVTEWRLFGLLLHYRWQPLSPRKGARLYRGHGLPTFLRPQWQKDRL